MKKLIYPLLLAPLALFVSCDKDDFQPFDMTLTLTGVTQANGTFYAVKGNNITINSLTVSPLGDKNTTAANVMFYIDNLPLFPNPWNGTDGIVFNTGMFQPGTYSLNVSGNLLQVDQSIQTFAAGYTLVIVNEQDDLPAGAPDAGTYSQTITFTK